MSKERGADVNRLSQEECKEIVDNLKKKKSLRKVKRGNRTFYQCTLAPTGKNKHAQKSLPKPIAARHVGISKKQLVHLIFYRAETGKLIEPGFEISHCDQDQTVLHLVAESHDMNESRKYCHKFGWYKVLPGEDKPRCPHWEHPCTGAHKN